MRHQIVKAFRLTGRQRLLLLEAGARLFWFRLQLWMLPFRRVMRPFRKEPEEAPAPRSTAGPGLVEDIRWAIAAAAHHGPWHMRCLPQALAAAAMLRARSIPATLFIGANPSQEEFLAHAWVVAQDIYVSGGRASADMPVLARFACC